jgi:hypothetical protein
VTSFPAVKGKDLISALRGVGFVVVESKAVITLSVTVTAVSPWFLFTPVKRLGLGSWQASCAISSSRVNSYRSCFEGSAV